MIARARKGRLFVIEGTDGSGKATQSELLVKRLRAAGHTVLPLSFPRYDHASSWLVRQYLAGEFGPADAVPPKVASTFFAYDRLDAAGAINLALAKGQDVVLDRWVSSNKGHQLGKITAEKERVEFLAWINQFEYATNQLPVPDLTILLYLDPAAAVSSSDKKGGVVHDVHESDLSHLRRAAEAYLWVAAHDAVENWQVIDCLDHLGQRLSRPAMHEQVWQEIKNLDQSTQRDRRKEPQQRVHNSSQQIAATGGNK